MYLKLSNLSKTHLKMGKFPQKETSTAVRSIPYAYYIIFAGALAVSLRQGMESWFWEKNEKIPSNHTIHEWFIFTHIYHKKSTIHVCKYTYQSRGSVMGKIDLNFRTWRSPNLWRPAPCFQQFRPLKTKTWVNRWNKKEFSRNFCICQLLWVATYLLFFFIRR